MVGGTACRPRRRWRRSRCSSAAGGKEPVGALRRGVQSLDRPGNRPGAARHGGGCRPGRRGRRERVAGLGRDAGRRAGAGAVPVSRAAGRIRPTSWPARHPRARQDPGRVAGLGPARHRDGRVRLRHPQPAHGPGAAEHRARRRLRDGPPPGRRLRRDHAVQLPGDGPALDVPGRAGLRQHVRPEALGEGAALGRPARRAADGVGPAGRGSSTSSTATGNASTPCSHTPWWRRSRSSARRRWRGTSTRPARGTASACRRRAGPRTT